MSVIRIGLVGAGGMATRHLPAWLSLGAEVVVYAHHGAPELTRRFGGKVVTSLDELLDHCDIVDVVTPTPAHREYVEAALRAGKDVICEKPLTRHHDDAVAMVRLAEREGRRLFPAHLVRYRPEYNAMRAAVHDGRIGEPAVARFTRTATSPVWSSWFADPEQSGGVVLDLMIHDLDIARWVCGDVAEVYATSSAGRHDDVPVSTGHVMLTHASGAISHVTGFWGPPGVQFNTSYHVAGTDGVLTFDSATHDVSRLNLGGAVGAATSGALPGAGEDPVLAELRDFSQAIGNGHQARLSARDGVVALDLALAALESIRTGTTVPFHTWSEDS